MMLSKVALLINVLAEMEGVVLACSGGCDSLLLSFVAHRTLGRKCHIAHVVGPSVPIEATERVKVLACREVWQTHFLSANEFLDEDYLKNPVNRCFFCKTHLYQVLTQLSEKVSMKGKKQFCLVSGTNTDDLNEYRPGLIAADQFGVRHPYVEAGMGKREIRQYARELGLSFSELPASPCLSSRLYTGTRVTAERLQVIHSSEKLLQRLLQLRTVRCRLKENEMFVEVLPSDRPKLTQEVMRRFSDEVKSIHPSICSVVLDPFDYKPGRAFEVVS